MQKATKCTENHQNLHLDMFLCEFCVKTNTEQETFWVRKCPWPASEKTIARAKGKNARNQMQKAIKCIENQQHVHLGMFSYEVSMKTLKKIHFGSRC